MKLSASDRVPGRMIYRTRPNCRSKCTATERPITRGDWLRIAAVAAFAGLVAVMNIRAA